MTKYDFKIRRRVFRSGKIRRSRDFNRFEKDFLKRKKSETRLRNLIIMIIIILLTTILIFSVRVMSATSGQQHQELKIKHTHQIL
jgi:heme/copper-type cytochrome/quinol oxidase subunit 2